MRCQECGWTPDRPVDNSAQTRIMVDHYADEHPEIFE